MSSGRVRSLLVTVAAAVSLVAVLAGSASAAVLTSQINAPTDPTSLPLLVEPVVGNSETILSVNGTVTTDDANAADSVELGCFYITAQGSTEELKVASLESHPLTLTVHPDGSFTTADLAGKEQAALRGIVRSEPCRLRAVPIGTLATSPVTSFKGPLISGSAEYDVFGNDESHLYDTYLQSTTLQGYWAWDTAGGCGPYGRVFDPNTYQASESYVSGCQANLFYMGETGSEASLIIGGHHAYTTDGAYSINTKGTPGQPFLTPSPPSYDPATGNMSETESEPLVACVKGDGSALDVTHPTGSECARFVPVGVELVRTIETGHSDLQATVIDRFRSTDAASHPITVNYGEGVGEAGMPSYRFPGEATFTTRTAGSSVSFGGAAPATVSYQTDSAATDPTSGLQNPRGAITVPAVPDTTKFDDGNRFEFVYGNRTVPATGSLTFVHVLSQALTQGEVDALSGAAEERLRAPTVIISSPANASSATAASTVVSGVAHSNLGLASLTLNGTAVAVGGGGAWSASVPLALGTNTITATATDAIGQSAGSSITVTRTAPPQGHAVQIGHASGAKGKLTLTLACVGAAGTVCHLHVSLSTLEKLRGHHLLGLAARARKHSLLVSLASTSVTIPAGSRVKLSISLNATGRRLLARFGHIPTHLVVVALEGTTRSTVIAQNLTVRRAPHRKHRRHHH